MMTGFGNDSSRLRRVTPQPQRSARSSQIKSSSLPTQSVQRTVNIHHIAPVPEKYSKKTKFFPSIKRLGLGLRRTKAGSQQSLVRQRKQRAKLVFWPKMRRFAFIIFILYLVALCTGFSDLLQLRQTHDSYKLSASTQSLLGPTVSSYLADKVSYDNQKQQYDFNANYKPDSGAVQVGGGQYSATLGENLSQGGISLTDPSTNITVRMKPKFVSMAGKEENGRIVYPLNRAGDQMIYSVRGNGLKEDIVVPSYQSNDLNFEYTLDLPTGTEARLLDNGDIGIYSANPTLFGNISYGSSSDKALVEKARENSTKTNLIFGIPAPVIKEANGSSNATAHFTLTGNQLTVVANNLKAASYPLSIDPSVVVSSTSDFTTGTTSGSLVGNNESNIDFTTTNDQVGRTTLTAGTLGTWGTNATGLNSGEFYVNTVVVDGFIYDIAPGTTAYAGTAVYRATISSSGVIGSFSATTSLPSSTGEGAVATANGYIYVLGGNANTTTPNSSVQYAAVCSGNNTTTAFTTNCNRSSTAGSLTSWSTTTSMNSALVYEGSAIYNGYIYAVGGCTVLLGYVCNGGYTTSTEYAPLNADGTIGAWTNGTTFTTGRTDFSFTEYNGYLYLAGGRVASNPVLGDVQYAKINSNGSIGVWAATTTLPATLSGDALIMTNGYAYVAGGQPALGSADANTVYYALINADGTIGTWNTTSTLGTSEAITSGFAYAGKVFVLGGCTSATCPTNPTSSAIQVATINTAGGANTLSPRITTGTTTIPAETNGEGRYAEGVLALNGYLYMIGGCVEDQFNDFDCGNTFTGEDDTVNTMRWATINADGSIGAWTVDTLTNANRLNGANGLAAFGLVSIENTIYAVGGFDGNNNAWTSSVFRISVSPTTGAPTSTAWTATTAILPAAYGFMGTVYEDSNATTGYIYAVGGCNAATAGGLGCSTYKTTVCAIPVTLSTGVPTACSTTTPATQTQMPTALGLMGFVYGGGYVYLIGGSNTTDSQNVAIYYAALTGNGITRSWNTATGTLPFTGGTAPNINGDRRAPAVYSNGHIFLFGGHNGNTSTTLSAIYDCQINPATGNILSNCSTSGQSLSTTRWNSSAATANGYVYDIGGCSVGGPPTSCTTISTAVDIYRINYGGVGEANAWTTSTSNLTTARYGNGLAAYNGFLYTAGGCTDSLDTCSATTNEVKGSAIAGDPTASRLSWTTTGMGTLPLARGRINLVACNGYLYAIGGYSGSADLKSYDYAPINTNGTLGTWATDSTNTLPSPVSTGLESYGSAVVNGRIYITGGSDAGTARSSTFIGTPGTNGQLTWAVASNNFTTARSMLGATAYNGYLYVAGGYDGTNYLQDVQLAQINVTTGDLGTWSYTASLPQRVRRLNLLALDGYMIFTGGEQSGGTTCNSNFWTSSIASNGQTHTMQRNTNAFTTTRSAAGAAVYDGYVYLAGGNCAAAAPTSSVVFAGFAAQPPIAQFSQELDTGVDTNPINLYIRTNRVSALGSQVNLLYRSASNATATYGQATQLYGLNDSPSLYNMSPVNSSGTIIDGNRYYLLRYTIDDSQSTTFPETAANDSAITDYEMYYHANTGYRLRNGETFTNQVNQSLDAHP